MLTGRRASRTMPPPIRELCNRHSWMDANRVGDHGPFPGAGIIQLAQLMLAPENLSCGGGLTRRGMTPWSINLSENPISDLPLKNRRGLTRTQGPHQAKHPRSRGRPP